MPRKSEQLIVSMTGRKSWTVPIAMTVVMLIAACSGSGGRASLTPSPGPSTGVGKSEEQPVQQTPEEAAPSASPQRTPEEPDGIAPAASPQQTAETKVPLAPPVFSFSTIDGEEIRLEDVLGTVPVYVLFVPSVDDELDRAQVGKVQARYAEFEALGANIFVIASDLPTKVLRLRDELGLEFPLIADPLNVIASDWQVFDLFGEGKSGPASFVFDAHGTLIARLVAAELDDRPSVDEVLRVIEESLSAGAA
ncbi:MAG: redoxin domain-containing protein [Chloroflexi bacterium]|nr:redoxin domain-containing protein [Chloroflexota bacterium]